VNINILCRIVLELPDATKQLGHWVKFAWCLWILYWLCRHYRPIDGMCTVLLFGLRASRRI